MNAPRDSYDDLMDLLSSGYKVRSFSEENSTAQFSIVAFESIDNTNPFQYSVSFRMSPRLANFMGMLRAPGEVVDKRFLRRDLRKGFILIDVVGFSTLALDFQVGLLSRFQQIIADSSRESRIPSTAIEGFLPTGDGCYIVFSESGIPTSLGFYDTLMSTLGGYNSENVSPSRIYFRTAINAGPVDYFRDLNGQWNYVGPGINNTERILSQVPKDQRNALLVAEDLSLLPMHANRTWGPITSFRDKHGIEHRYRQLLH